MIKYKDALHSFYNLRSEIKFKGHELTLDDDRAHVTLKDLKTGKKYTCRIYETMFCDADKFIEWIKNSLPGW
jgi:hypothetical protein